MCITTMTDMDLTSRLAYARVERHTDSPVCAHDSCRTSSQIAGAVLWNGREAIGVWAGDLEALDVAHDARREDEVVEPVYFCTLRERFAVRKVA